MRILDQVFQEIFCQIHVIVNVVKGHFGLYHPEFCHMARRIGVFCPEGWTKGIDGRKRQGSQFTLQLSGDGQIGGASKKILVEIDLTLPRFPECFSDPGWLP